MIDKLYFGSLNDEHCYPLAHFVEQMQQSGESSMTLYTAVRSIGIKQCFFCVAHRDWFDEADEPCGSHCESYAPINGGVGMCEHQRFEVYEKGELIEITIKRGIMVHRRNRSEPILIASSDFETTCFSFKPYNDGVILVGFQNDTPTCKTTLDLTPLILREPLNLELSCEIPLKKYRDISVVKDYLTTEFKKPKPIHVLRPRQYRKQAR